MEDTPMIAQTVRYNWSERADSPLIAGQFDVVPQCLVCHPLSWERAQDAPESAMFPWACPNRMKRRAREHRAVAKRMGRNVDGGRDDNGDHRRHRHQ